MATDGLTWCAGVVSVIDTALLLSCFERRNLRHMIWPVLMLLAAVWSIHVGEFANLLLAESQGTWAEVARVLAMAAMAFGLLGMPSGLLHASSRLWRTGLEVAAARRPSHALAYLPLTIWPWGVWSILSRPGEPFLARVESFVLPYLALSVVVTAIAAWSFGRFCRRSCLPEQRRFLQVLAVLLVALLGLLTGMVVAWRIGHLASDSAWFVVMTLVPIGPTLWFAYYVIRYRFLELVLERTVVYGAILTGMVLFHGLIRRHATDPLADRWHVDFGMVEALLVLILILIYQPLRRRVAESLRYLLGRDATGFREQTRRIAVEQWEHLEDPPQQLLDWFVPRVAEAFDVSRAAGWLFDLPTGTVWAGNATFPAEATRELYAALPPHSFVTIQGGEGTSWRTVDLLRGVGASLAVRVDHAQVSGLLLLGRRSRARDFSEEEANAVLLLAELLGATLHGHYLHELRRTAEQTAARQDKLATLGMLTSCLAHEIKNPLSSIRTIATIMAEQVVAENPQAEDPQSADLRLILDEVERLSRTTSQFLQFARPSPAGTSPMSIETVVASTVQVLAHLARSRGVRVEMRNEAELPAVAADDGSLREIVFNLLLNAIEAVENGGQVEVSTSRGERGIQIRVRDNGPGIDPESRERIFAPFYTSKPAGTGLGLFIARRNVEQLGGSIDCDSQPGGGTCFTVTLPLPTP